MLPHAQCHAYQAEEEEWLAFLLKLDIVQNWIGQQQGFDVVELWWDKGTAYCQCETALSYGK